MVDLGKYRIGVFKFDRFFFRKSVLCSLRLFFLSNRVEGSRGKFYQCVYLEELIN